MSGIVTRMFYRSINFFRYNSLKTELGSIYCDFCLLVANNYFKEYKEYRATMRNKNN